jgi:predicted RNA-binding Zn-ribbon protein involved in translation (DUF1610 family)
MAFMGYLYQESSNSKKYLTAVTCPWCGSSVLEPGSIWEYYTCPDCGTIYQADTKRFKVPEHSLELKNKNCDKYSRAQRTVPNTAPTAPPKESYMSTKEREVAHKNMVQEDPYRKSWGRKDKTETIGQEDMFKASKKRGRL